MSEAGLARCPSRQDCSTLASAIAWSAARFSDAGISSAHLDAELLLAGILNYTRAALYAHFDDPLSSDSCQEFTAVVERRARGEPLAYITKQREFWSLRLHVDPSVLIPRPDTELLVELALARIPVGRLCTILDLGTGSGAIACAIAGDRPRCIVWAADASKDALALARHNAELHGFSNIRFAPVGDWLAPLRRPRFDAIVCNPPYIARGDACLAQLRFEPRAALVSPKAGYAALTTVICSARARLKSGGFLLVEHGSNQGMNVRRLFQRNGYRRVRGFADLAGRDRASLGYSPHLRT